jgi:hypothetical protein
MIRSLTLPLALLTLLAVGPSGVWGQEAADEVLLTVETLFDAMAAGDAESAAGVLLPQGQWVSIRPEDRGITIIPHGDFLDRLAERSQVWLERMWAPRVLVEGPVAVVWTPYDFHRDGAFSHCGMEAFTLVQTAEGWRIAGATYSVQSTGCPPSPLGPPGPR